MKLLQLLIYAIGLGAWGISIYYFYSEFIPSIFGFVAGAAMLGLGYSLGKEDRV